MRESSLVDRESLLTLRRTGRHVALCAVVAAVIWVYSGPRNLPHFSLSLQYVWSTAALWVMAFALGRRERVGAPSWNHWDEGMSFNCLSLGLHIVQRMLT